MKRVEDYIEAYTRRCSNELEEGVAAMTGDRYAPWLTPEHARSVVEITREETLNSFIYKGIKWLEEKFSEDDQSSGRGEWIDIRSWDFDSMEEMIKDFRKTMENDE